MKLIVALLLSAAFLSAGPDSALYLGTWKIISAAPAPWASGERKPNLPEGKHLTGKLVKFEPKRILGPHQVACPDPDYRIKSYPADMLFQGSFGEMKTRDPSVDVAKAAALAGFRNGTEWKTLETGCETEVEFHFIDATTAAFGLNNIIYTLKKQ